MSKWDIVAITLFVIGVILIMYGIALLRAGIVQGDRLLEWRGLALLGEGAIFIGAVSLIGTLLAS